MIIVSPHTGDSRRCSNCHRDDDPPVDLRIAGVGVTLCPSCLDGLHRVTAPSPVPVPTPTPAASAAHSAHKLDEVERKLGNLTAAYAVVALASFRGVRVEPRNVSSNCVEARLYLPATAIAAELPGDERHRGRAALYALAAAVELAMRDGDWWSTSVYFHADGTDAAGGYRGAVIIDCGSARATAITMLRGLAAQLEG